MVAVAVLFGVLIAVRYPLRYRAAIADACAEFGLSPRFVSAVIWTESKFRPQATSHKGARGLMQIMPETGAYLAAQLKVDYSPEALYDPEYNVRLGTYYLSRLLKRFDKSLALAAYNAGETRAAYWEKTGEIDYPETRAYIERIFWAEKAYRFRGVPDQAS